MLSVITVAIPSTSTTAERGIEMFNIAAAGNLAELGRRIRTARTKLHWSQEAFAGVCGLERSYYGGVERGKRNVTFKVLCLSCDGMACGCSHDHPGPSSLGPIAAFSIGKWTGPPPPQCPAREARGSNPPATP